MRLHFCVLFFFSSTIVSGQQIDSPYEWGDSNNLEFINQFGGAYYSIEDNPMIDETNDSESVARFIKQGEKNSDWAGIFVDLQKSLIIKEGTKLKLQVYSASNSGILKLKLEKKVLASYPAVLEIDKPLPLSDSWQEVEFDISFAPSNTVTRIVLFFDFGNGEPSEFFFDNLTLD